MSRVIDALTPESLDEMIKAQQPPCMSLYQPTHRQRPQNQQDPIRYRNLVRVLEASLRQKYSAEEALSHLRSFEDLTQDPEFWNHALDGLAVLGGPGLFRVFRVQRPVPELAIVADSFHTKPLRRFLQSVGRYQVLGLGLVKIRLFEGNRDVLDEIEPAPGVPRTIAEALGDQLSEPHLTVASYGGAGQASSPMRHGHGGKMESAQTDAERFFRSVDRAVYQHHSKPSGLPLMLAALPEHHGTFHQVSHNPLLMKHGVTTNPEALPIEDLRDLAWQVVEPEYQLQLAVMADEFGTARARGLGSEDLEHVAEAAVAGRVATLILDSDRHIPGRLDLATGHVQTADLDNPEVDDILDDLGELVRDRRGRVVVVPPGQVPGTTGLAATFRY